MSICVYTIFVAFRYNKIMKEHPTSLNGCVGTYKFISYYKFMLPFCLSIKYVLLITDTRNFVYRRILRNRPHTIKLPIQVDGHR